MRESETGQHSHAANGSAFRAIAAAGFEDGPTGEPKTAQITNVIITLDDETGSTTTTVAADPNATTATTAAAADATTTPTNAP